MLLKQRQKTSTVTAHLLLRGCGASDPFITALRSSISENVHTLYKSLTNTIVAYLYRFILFLPCLQQWGQKHSHLSIAWLKISVYAALSTQCTTQHGTVYITQWR